MNARIKSLPLMLLLFLLLFMILLSVEFYRENLYPTFTVIVLPDTQYYTFRYPHLFDAQTRWIRENKSAMNILFAFHEGDVTDHNTREEWERASKSMELLDGEVPYAIAPGNHDTGRNANTRNTALFNRYFGVWRYRDCPWFGGLYEEGKMDNCYHYFNAGRLRYLVLVLEFAPRDRVLEWANTVVERHPEHRVIIITHLYLYSDNTLHGSKRSHAWAPAAYGVGRSAEGANDGVRMWDKLVRRHKNISFVFCGHTLNDGNGILVSKGDHGNTVYQMLINYQMNPEGGGGYLRSIEINPNTNSVSIQSYSPYHDLYIIDENNEFILSGAEVGAVK
ncbi:MAG: metallophosphoesterase [Spirochaetales bacterium]|nr:metallophosphoesterase [Spirochaetales bacterium]